MSTDRVSTEDLAVAIEWLSVNEGEEGEAESCQRVVAWLEAEKSRREDEAAIRALMRAASLPRHQVVFILKQTGLTPRGLRAKLDEAPDAG